MVRPRLLACSAAALALGLAPSAGAQCPAPGAPTITVFSNLDTAKGQTYVLAWSASTGLGAGGHYEVQRSATENFASIETFSVSTISASLTSDRLGTSFHRVRGVQACGTAGPASGAVPITIVDGQPVVIFTVQPVAKVRTVGDPASTSSFEVQNIGGQHFLGYVSPRGNTSFLSFPESIVDLAPGERKTFPIEFYSELTNTPDTYVAVITIQSGTGAQPKAYPWALVNLTVAPKPARGREPLAGDNAPPVFETDFVSFQATAASKDPPPVTVRITNPRASAIALAAETGPDGWLSPDNEWNERPLAPGETRTFAVESKRIQGESGGVLPRYAFLTVRTQDGQSARVQFQDLDDTSGGNCTTRPLLAAGESSLIVPSTVTTDFLKNGRRVVFISKLLLSNVGTDPVVADLYFTRDTGDPSTDGFDCSRVLKATVQIPGSDVLSLTDPLSRLFGFKPLDLVSGALEVRSSKIAQIRADSVVDSPAPGGGAYGFQLPVVKRGTGATSTADHFISGLVSDPTYRSNLILAESTGKSATVLLTIYDGNGAVLYRTTRTLPPYAKVQINDGDIFKGQQVPAASVTLSVIGGDGSVVGLATVIDNTNQDASSFLSRPLPTGAVAAARRPLAGLPYRFVVPTVVNGFDSKLGRGPAVYPYESTLSLTNGTASAKSYSVTYIPSVGFGAPATSATLTLGPRQTVSYDNVLKQVFGIDSNSTGELLVDMDSPSVIMSSRVFSKTNDGNFGDAVPVMPSNTSAATAAADQKRLIADGFEHSIDASRGARTNLVLAEIDGKPATVEVRLFEKGKERSGPIGTKTITVGAYEKLQLNPVFVQLGVEGKDRTNVLCEVVAQPGSQGRVVALGTRVDNGTADPKILAMVPIGETQGGPTIGF